jgi:hypothetical protein
MKRKIGTWWIHLEVRIFTGTLLGNIGKRDTCNAAFRHVKVRRRGYYESEMNSLSLLRTL